MSLAALVLRYKHLLPRCSVDHRNHILMLAVSTQHIENVSTQVTVVGCAFLRDSHHAQSVGEFCWNYVEGWFLHFPFVPQESCQPLCSAVKATTADDPLRTTEKERGKPPKAQSTVKLDTLARMLQHHHQENLSQHSSQCSCSSDRSCLNFRASAMQHGTCCPTWPLYTKNAPSESLCLFLL